MTKHKAISFCLWGVEMWGFTFCLTLETLLHIPNVSLTSTAAQFGDFGLRPYNE